MSDHPSRRATPVLGPGRYGQCDGRPPLARGWRRRLAPDPDRGYEWWTVGRWRSDRGWGLKLGPVTVYDEMGYRGVTVLQRVLFERAR